MFKANSVLTQFLSIYYKVNREKSMTIHSNTHIFGLRTTLNCHTDSLLKKITTVTLTV